MKTTIPLYLIASGIACIGLQNAGIIRPYRIPETRIYGSVTVNGGSTFDLNLFHCRPTGWAK